MQQVFIREEDLIDDKVVITGEDAKHLGKVVRIRVGEVIRVSTSAGESYLCEIQSANADEVIASVKERTAETEPGNRIYLFQAIPKGDRMETVIEKAVELGVYEIIPVEMKYCVVKLDDKKKRSKVERWQKVAESAAKQSKRSLIPNIHEVVSFKEALKMANECEVRLVPYENEEGMKATKESLLKITTDKSVSIIVGPEGGFAPEEIESARETMDVISLGKRILRTDTAAITAMSLVMLQSELAEADN